MIHYCQGQLKKDLGMSELISKHDYLQQKKLIAGGVE